jgi:hypothetical protein
MFVGFDAYQKAMDALKPHDIAIMTTPPAFRWVHFKYAIEKNLNVFMEKPVTVDGPSTRRMLELADQSLDKNLKVGVGLMCRTASRAASSPIASRWDRWATSRSSAPIACTAPSPSASSRRTMGSCPSRSTR